MQVPEIRRKVHTLLLEGTLRLDKAGGFPGQYAQVLGSADTACSDICAVLGVQPAEASHTTPALSRTIR